MKIRSIIFKLKLIFALIKLKNSSCVLLETLLNNHAKLNFPLDYDSELSLRLSSKFGVHN